MSVRIQKSLRWAVGLAGLSSVAAQCRPRSATLDMSNHTYSLTGVDCPAHDPSIGAVVDANGKARYFAYATDGGGVGQGSLRQWCSSDAIDWELCGYVLPNGLPSWVKQYVPGATNSWAPDVSYFSKLNGGVFTIFYAVSEFGKTVSCIGLATSPVQDPQDPAFKGWADSGSPVFCTNSSSNFNAIDANVVWDKKTGAPYLVFGSFWSGIQAVALDPTTGMLAQGAKVTNIASRDQAGSNQAIEGAFMVSNGTSYWLFASWNHCCQGAKSNYEVRVGRSDSILGPFLDASGTPMLQGGGTYFIGGANSVGNPVQGQGFGWAAGGGQSILRSSPGNPVPNDGSSIVLHGYDAQTGDPWMQLLTIDWSGEWPAIDFGH